MAERSRSWLLGRLVDGPLTSVSCVLALALVAAQATGEDQRSFEEEVARIAVSERGRRLSIGHPEWDMSGPAVATGGGSDALLAWIASEPGGTDHVLASRRVGGRWREPVAVSSVASACLRPAAIATGADRYVVIWTARDGERWSVRARTIEGGEPREEVVLATDAAGPAVAAGRDGVAVAAWESYRGDRRRIVARIGDGATWGAETVASSDAGPGDAHPTVGIDASGGVWLAWSSPREHGTCDDEVLLRKLAPERGAARVASTSPYTDSFPSLVPTENGLALVWAESEAPVNELGELRAVAWDRWSDETLRMARLEDGELAEPLLLRPSFGDHERAPADGAAGAEVDGRLVFVHAELKTRRENRFDQRWRTAMLRETASGDFEGPIDVSDGASNDGADPAVGSLDGELFWVETVVDDLQRVAPTWLRGTSTQPGTALAGPIPDLGTGARSVVSGRPPIPLPPAERPRIDPGAGPLAAYWGTLHLHSSLSRDARGPEGGPLANYRVCEDRVGLDFAMLSDHVEHLRRDEWWRLCKLADLCNRPGSFVTLPGYEWTSFQYGHKNVVFGDMVLARRTEPLSAKGNDPAQLWEHLAGLPALAIPHHPSSAINRPTDWSFRSAEHQRLVEIFQARGSFEADDAPLRATQRYERGHSVRDALGMGHRLGFVASPDHGGGLGLAGVWAEELTRASLFDALHARRTFATTGAPMAVWLEVSGVAMGTVAPAPERPFRIRARIEATVEGPLEVFLVRNGTEVFNTTLEGPSADLVRDDAGALVETTYWYVRVHQADGHVAWSSPVWLEP